MDWDKAVANGTYRKCTELNIASIAKALRIQPHVASRPKSPKSITVRTEMTCFVWNCDVCSVRAELPAEWLGGGRRGNGEGGRFGARRGSVGCLVGT